MTSTPAATSEYVVEFLLGRYCASTDPTEIEEGLQIVEKQLCRCWSTFSWWGL
jgi:predicted ATP-dependent Lon-type protease